MDRKWIENTILESVGDGIVEKAIISCGWILFA